MSLPVYSACDLDVSLAEALPGQTCLLAGAEGHHGAAVKRQREGEQLVVVDGRGGYARCVVTGAQRHQLQLRITATGQVPASRPRLGLVQAIAKGGRDLQALEAAVELGVDQVIPWAAARCVARWEGAKAAKQHAKWVNQAVAAAKQSRRAHWPQVHPAATTAQLASRMGADSLVLLTEPAAAVSLPQVLDTVPAAANIWVIVGPEGGISPPERQLLVAAGAVEVCLGPTVMRTSSAGPAALAVIAAATGRWQAHGAQFVREEAS